MCFLIEAVYCMTWIWTLHRAHNQWKSPIEEDNVWASIKHVDLLLASVVNVNYKIRKIHRNICKNQLLLNMFYWQLMIK